MSTTRDPETDPIEAHCRFRPRIIPLIAKGPDLRHESTLTHLAGQQVVGGHVLRSQIEDETLGEVTTASGCDYQLALDEIAVFEWAPSKPICGACLAWANDGPRRLAESVAKAVRLRRLMIAYFGLMLLVCALAIAWALLR